jgi:hypothetical protein
LFGVTEIPGGSQIRTLLDGIEPSVAGAIVKPGTGAVIPVMAEPVRKGDGEQKQDCGHETGKRRFTAHGQEY